MRGDGKSKFYRTLNLNKEIWNTLKLYNELKKEINKDDKQSKKNNWEKIDGNL